MLTILHRLPDLGILAVILLVLVGAVLFAPIIGHSLFGLTDNKERDDAAFDAFKAIMSMTGVVLAFSLVQATANLRAIEANVGKEAATLSAIDRVLLRIDVPAFAHMRPLLASYGDSLIRDEWPQLALQRRSDRTERAYSLLSRAVRSVTVDTPRQQAMYNELLKVMDDAADLREQIIADSELSLPSFFWTTVAGLMLIGFALACVTDATLNRRTGLAATTAAVALLLAFVVIIDVPFEGQTSVSTREIRNVLLVNAHRS